MAKPGSVPCLPTSIPWTSLSRLQDSLSPRTHVSLPPSHTGCLTPSTGSQLYPEEEHSVQWKEKKLKISSTPILQRQFELHFLIDEEIEAEKEKATLVTSH